MLRRNYVDASDVEQTEEQLALAEALVDDYVGAQDRYLPQERVGTVSYSLEGKIIDTNNGTPLFVTDNTYARCIIEIIGGSGVGQSRFITSSSREERSVSFDGDVFNPALDDTSVYRIYQLAKFPRRKDARTPPGSNVIYKFIPEAIKEAVKAQAAFIAEMGDDYFTGDDSEMDSESIMSYSYSRGGNAGQAAIVKFMSPKARTLLRGYKNRTGRLVRGGPNVA